MSKEPPESCPSTQSTWLLTRKAIFLLLLLFPSAPTRGSAAFLDRRYLRLATWQTVTSSRQQSSKVSFATHLTLQSLRRSQPNQANLMDFSFLWIPTHIKHTMMLRTQRQDTNLSRCSSTHWHSPFFLYFLLNKAVSKLIGECKSTGKCQNDLATVLHLSLVPIMMKTYITIATFHIAIRLCSYCCMSRVIGQHNIQVEVLFPWGKKKFTCTIFSFLIFFCYSCF